MYIRKFVYKKNIIHDLRSSHAERISLSQNNQVKQI